MMRRTIGLAACAMVAAALGCGGGGKTDTSTTTAKPPSDPLTTFGPLEVGAGYEGWTRVTKQPHPSPTHGNRFAEIFVNDVALAAYTGEDDLPVGSILVKRTWERDGDQPSTTPGPVFVMEKREAGFAPDHEDWYYAIHWADPPPKFAKQFGGPVYWRSPSPKVDYCWKCHENYDREIGLPPREARTWEQPEE